MVTISIKDTVGQQQQTVDVAIVDDLNIEASEALGLWLFNPVGRQIDSTIAVVTITDNDSQSPANPVVSIADVNVSESVGNAVITVSLSEPAGTATSAGIHTGTGTAQGGQDYYGFTRRVNFVAGQTQQTVNVTILDDGTAESPATETLQMRLYAPTGLSIGNDSATITIEDDD